MRATTHMPPSALGLCELYRADDARGCSVVLLSAIAGFLGKVTCLRTEPYFTNPGRFDVGRFATCLAGDECSGGLCTISLRRENKMGQFRVLQGVARSAKNDDIAGVGPVFGKFAIVLYMMSMQMAGFAAPFAFSDTFDGRARDHHDCHRASKFLGSTFPWRLGNAHALSGTIEQFAAIALTAKEHLSAFLAGVFRDALNAPPLHQVGAFNGTGMSLRSHVGLWASKFFTAGTANEGDHSSFWILSEIH